MADLVIKGFRSTKEAYEFVSWYGEQGEQDAAIWFELCEEEGKMDRSFIPIDFHKKIVTTGDVVTAHVKP